MPKIDEQIEVKDQRKKSFFIADNRMIDEAAPVIGVYGGAVYNSLLRHADKEKKTWPSCQTIAREWGISPRQVMRGIEMLEKYGLIYVIRTAGKHNVYRINDPKDWSLPITSDSQSLVEEQTSDSQSLVTGETSDSQSQVPVTDSHPKYTQSNKIKSISRESDKFHAEQQTKKPKIGPQVNYLEEINKQMTLYDKEIQLAIKLLLDGIASKNKSGDMTQGRYLNLLFEISTVASGTNREILKEALTKATKAGAETVNYVKAVIKTLTEKRDRNNKIDADQQKTNEDRPHYSKGRGGEWYKNNKLVSKDQVPEEIRKQAEGHRHPPPAPVTQIIGDLAGQFNMHKKRMQIER